MTETNLHQLTGAYALDALDDDEEGRFIAHLDGCETCQAEVTGLVSTAARLSDVVAIAPPPSLRERVLQAADRTRQEPPVVTRLDAARRRRRVITGAIASALVAAAIVTGIVVTNNEPSQADVIASIVQAPDSQTLNGVVDGGGSATVFFSASLDEGAVKLSDLPLVAADKIYELWLLPAEGAPIAAGTFRPAADGAVTKVMTDTGTAVGMALTVEPAPGGPRPLGPTVLSVKWA
jgi:anti-sigma-K factor RskA